jgi:integrase
MISNLFKSYTGVPVSPHALRHIFCTYLDELEEDHKIGLAERRSFAHWMKHSLEMQQKDYNHTKQEAKLRPGEKAMDLINQDFLGAK